MIVEVKKENLTKVELGRPVREVLTTYHTSSITPNGKRGKLASETGVKLPRY